MAHKVTLIPGDGIGPEVADAAVRILEATGVKFEWESFAAGADAYEKYGEYIPKELNDVHRTQQTWRSKDRSRRPLAADFRQHQRHVCASISSCIRKFPTDPQPAPHPDALPGR